VGFCLSVALRGVTVRFYPYSLGFVALTVAGVVVTCALLVGVSCILGWVPVGETRAAGRNVCGPGGGADPDAPTELLPLVEYPASWLSGEDGSGGGGGGDGGNHAHHHHSRQRSGTAGAGGGGGGPAQSPGGGGGGGSSMQRRRGSGNEAAREEAPMFP
jgi:hypothetical protein